MHIVLQSFIKNAQRNIMTRRLWKEIFTLVSRLRLFPGKLKSKWLGPYVVKEVNPYGTIELEDPKSH